MGKFLFFFFFFFFHSTTYQNAWYVLLPLHVHVDIYPSWFPSNLLFLLNVVRCGITLWIMRPHKFCFTGEDKWLWISSLTRRRSFCTDHSWQKNGSCLVRRFLFFGWNCSKNILLFMLKLPTTFRLFFFCLFKKEDNLFLEVERVKDHLTASSYGCCSL